MDWQAIGPHKDTVIWVRKLRAGCWVAAVTPLPVPPASMPGFASPSGEMVLPEGFESQAAAVEAAKRYILGERERRAAGPDPSEADSQTRPNRRVSKRRQFTRIPVSLPVIGRAPQYWEMSLRGTVRSVGPGGLMVEFPVVVVRDSILRLALQTGLGPLEVEGRVVWILPSKTAVRHGLAFNESRGLDFAAELDVPESLSGDGAFPSPEPTIARD